MRHTARSLLSTTLLALAVSATAAAGAKAAKKLVIFTHGMPAPVGEEVFNRVKAGLGPSPSCYLESRAEIQTNEKATDKIGVGLGYKSGCISGGYPLSFTGQVKSVQFAASGKAVIRFSPKVIITYEWFGKKCTYDVAKYTGTLEPGEARAVGTAVVPVTKSSPSDCQSPLNLEFEDALLNDPEGSVLPAQVIG